MDILRDGIWQFWGVVVGLASIIITLVIYILQRNKKRLALSILTDTPLLSVNEEVKGKIQIIYDNKEIQNIHLIVMKLENIGNMDISKVDFEQPIILTFPNSEILSAELSDTFPKNLMPTIHIDNSKLTIDPVMLNRGDHLTFKFMFATYGNNIEVNTRIIGVKEVERRLTGNSPITMNAAMGGVLMLVATTSSAYMALILMFYDKRFADPSLWGVLLFSGFIGIFALLYVYEVLKELIKGNK